MNTFQYSIRCLSNENDKRFKMLSELFKTIIGSNLSKDVRSSVDH